MDGKELKKHLLSGKKSERVVFAVTPEMKTALERIAEEKCTNVSAMLTQLTIEEVLANKDIFQEVDV